MKKRLTKVKQLLFIFSSKHKTLKRALYLTFTTLTMLLTSALRRSSARISRAGIAQTKRTSTHRAFGSTLFILLASYPSQLLCGTPPSMEKWKIFLSVSIPAIAVTSYNTATFPMMQRSLAMSRQLQRTSINVVTPLSTHQLTLFSTKTSWTVDSRRGSSVATKLKLC